MNYREASVSDIQGMHVVRMAVKENVLNNPLLVTEADYINFLTVSGKGWVCTKNNVVVGFAIVDTVKNNIWALFVHPDYEGKGIGKTLHNLMLNWFFFHSDADLWLTTAPGTRAQSFYTESGWKEVGMEGKEVKFEMTKEDWELIMDKFLI
jgi:GNAT superfamily N-acetyltransferase